jgi:hypothetical protein
MRFWNRANPATPPRPPRDEAEAFATYAPFFLDRLLRLASLKALPTAAPPNQRLIDRALYATYWDCVRAGARDEAVELLAAANRTQASPEAERRALS